MDIYREKYKNIKGKNNSLYLYILYECTQEKIKDHIKKQIENIEKINDAFRRKMYLSRYHTFRDVIENNSDDYVYNCVVFINNDVEQYDLSNESKELLKKFDHCNISFSYDDHYDLEYLEDMIFNDDPYHMFRVNNNKIDYLHLTKTKKVILQSKESKPLNIMEFINELLPLNTRYIIYGISSKLKDISDERAYDVINGQMKDDELIDIIKRVDQEDLLTQLCSDLEMINDSKQMHKLIFKKEIASKIQNSLIQRLYIDSKLVNKFIENMTKGGFDMNFRTIIIDSSIKSFIENREKSLSQYDGVLGITYY